MTSLRELMQREGAKRDRNVAPAERWRLILATIAWAERQATVRRNTQEACLANQRRLLGSMGQSSKRVP
jgi:hypothetical protein